MKIKEVYNGMDIVSADYNKGYQKAGIYFLSDVARDSDLNPYKIFKQVIPRKLKNGALWSIQDEKSVVYRIINDEGIKETETLGG
ncbi:hypothetical protein BGZ65_002852, partial [Modicella reniformis]